MYAEYFGLTEPPFSIAPNPQYLFMSTRHQEALAHLTYGIQSDGGFILLTGEVGTGKTTLCRKLLQEMPSGVDVAFVLNPRVSTTELLESICDEFGVSYPETPSGKQLVDALNRHLLDAHAAGRQCVLIIDEAQNLSRDLLEQLRLLTNLETNERKLLQILLLGQPELLDILSQENLRQFSQRITARFHLNELDRRETAEYINHRLETAGADGPLFTRAAMNRVFSLSDGTPRLINLICDRALLGAYAQAKQVVDVRTVRKAAEEVLGREEKNYMLAFSAAAMIFVMVLSGGWLLSQWEGDQKIIEPVATTRMTAPPPQPIAGHSDLERAYHDLFAIWGAAFLDSSDAACDLAPTIGLKCFHQRATLEDIRTLNRPVLVETSMGFLTLSEASENRVTLIAGDRQYDISNRDFGSIFTGDIHLFWRTPPAYTEPLKLQDTGAAVDWLVIQLSLMQGLTPTMAAGYVYDEEMANQVRDFQASRGLTPDGIVDPLTWIHLNSIEAVNIPTLTGQG